MSRKQFKREPAPGQLWMERTIGLIMVAFALTNLVHVRVGLARPVLAAAVQERATTGTTGTLNAAVASDAQEFMAKHKPAGLAIGVIDGSTSFVLGLGEVKQGTGKAPDENTIFEIGSITKTFTATVLAELVLRGEVKLDQPVEELLRGARGVPSFEKRKITLVDLATHTSGLPRLPDAMLLKLFIPGYGRNPYSSYSVTDLFEYLNGYQLKVAPGTEHTYSNIGAGVLGLALAQNTSSTCEDMYRRYVCAPLRMNDTVISLSPAQKKRLATGYLSGASAGSVQMLKEAANWDFQDAFAGAGALKSTAADMLLYLAANLDATSSPLNAACAFAHEPRFTDSDTTIGLTWMTTPITGVGDVIWHNGGTGGYSSMIALHKFTRRGVVVLCNTSNNAVTDFGFKILQTLAQRNLVVPRSAQ